MANTRPLRKIGSSQIKMVQLCAILFVCFGMAIGNVSTLKEPLQEKMEPSVEQRLEKLEKLMEKLVKRMDQQDVRITATESMGKIGEKVNFLEAQMTSLVFAMQHSYAQENQSMPNINNPVDFVNAEERMSGAPFRTCHETRLSDLTLSSGMYWIDPDGQGIGDDPIYVYCDMATGSTAILHNSEELIDVGHCPDAGCYSRPIVYSASTKQINTLNQLSAECHQSIRYDCSYAPFLFDGTSYGWWNDWNRNVQTFWSGDGSKGHTCQCGLDNNCVDAMLDCNCDSLIPIPLYDAGVITNKNYLPVSQLNFGRTSLTPSSSGAHTLGRFVCSGAVAVNGMPTSCEDLWRIGHQLSGFYPIKGATSIDMVYCNFAKPSANSEFQKWIGQVDVMSSPVYFEVYRNSAWGRSGILRFDGASINMGGAMNPSTGIFTAPRDGIYFFIFVGSAEYTGDKKGLGDMYVEFNVDGQIQGGNSMHISDHWHETDAVTIHCIVKLSVGSHVYVNIPGLEDSRLRESSSHRNRFSGFLIREDLF